MRKLLVFGMHVFYVILLVCAWFWGFEVGEEKHELKTQTKEVVRAPTFDECFPIILEAAEKRPDELAAKTNELDRLWYACARARPSFAIRSADFANKEQAQLFTELREKVKPLQAQNEELCKELNLLKPQNNSLREEVKTLQVQNGELRRQSAAADSVSKEQAQLFADLREEAKNLRAQNDELRKQNVALASARDARPAAPNRNDGAPIANLFRDIGGIRIKRDGIEIQRNRGPRVEEARKGSINIP